MILEGLVTTIDANGGPHIAPMGPVVEGISFTSLILKPFQTSMTCQNLLRHREGVFHITDDVLLLSRTAIGQSIENLAFQPAQSIRGNVIPASCRAFEFIIQDVNTSKDRAEMIAKVVAEHRFRDFFGFNRAKHAVLEAAILATRLHLLDQKEVLSDFARWRVIIDKTGGAQEHEAMNILEQYCREFHAK